MPRFAILTLCVLTALMLAAQIFGSGFGWGGVPRVGLWGMQLAPSAPFTFAITSLDPGRAADRAGIRPGDVIDMRMQNPIVRMWLLNEPIAERPTNVTILRNGRPFVANVKPDAINFSRRYDIFLFAFAVVWMLAFAAILAWRRPESRDVQLLSLTIVFLAIGLIVVNFSGSSPVTYVVEFLALAIFKGMALILWVLYCGSFAFPLSPQRRVVHGLAIAAAAISIAVGIGAVIGELTLSFSADGFLHLYGGRSEDWHVPYDVGIVLAVAAGVMAIGASRGEERQRAVWALVPLALLFVSNAISTFEQGAQSSYEALLFWIAVRNVFIFVAPIGLTYAALGRRLLDVGFVVNRALIFGIFSIIVVGVFMLVEWGASEWFASTNRAAPMVVSMVAALVLGFSMRFIHQRVDRFVDEVFFRKRHEDEAALRRFAHEAAYITDRTTLIGRTIAAVREHAGAATVQLLIADGTGRDYVSTDGADDGLRVSENDAALLAMRAWHKPVDLDTLETSIKGEYAYPMIFRGNLVGALVCGLKTDGENYAPDESHALSELAHGVGTALVLLGDESSENTNAVLERLEELSRRIDEMYAVVRQQERPI